MNIFITGANRGIGLELARQYRSAQHNVMTTVRDVSKADELKTIGAEIYTLDVSSENDCDALAKEITESIDILICNAGSLNSYDDVESRAHDQQAFENVLMTNIAGPYFVSRAFLPHIKKGTGKKIAIISSHMGTKKSTLKTGAAPIYRASKAGATNLAWSLSNGLKDYGIAVGAYHPGWVVTDMGGANAEVSTTDSAAGLIQQFDCLNMGITGCFVDYQGKVLG